MGAKNPTFHILTEVNSNGCKRHKVCSDLVLKVQTGTDPGTGEPIVRLRRYTRVKPEATHEAVYDVGQAIAGLQQHPLVEITRQDDLSLATV